MAASSTADEALQLHLVSSCQTARRARRRHALARELAVLPVFPTSQQSRAEQLLASTDADSWEMAWLEAAGWCSQDGVAAH